MPQTPSEPAAVAPQPTGAPPEPAVVAPEPTGAPAEPAAVAPQPTGTPPGPTDVAPQPTGTEAGPAPEAPKSPQRPKLARRILRIVGMVVAVIIAVVGIIAVLIGFASHTATDGEVTAFGHPVVIVSSDSMSSTINNGDLVVDDPVTASQAEHLHVGQIITYYEKAGSHTVITDRIVAVTNVDGHVAYTTKGDADNAPDAGPRLAANVIGTYSYKITDGGYVVTALHKWFVLGLILAALVLWLLAGVLFLSAGEAKETRGPEPAAGIGPDNRAVPQP